MIEINEHHVNAAEPAPGTRRDGFALPMAIVVLSLLTMGLVAGFSMTASELSTTASQRAQARAYTNAQMGLETFLTRRKERTGTGSSAVSFCPHCWTVNATAQNGAINPHLNGTPTQRETVTVAFNNGAAIVRATPVWVNAATGSGKYFITSTGYDNTSNMAGGSGRTARASRTVGVFVTWSKTTMNVVGAWTSLSGITKQGTGVISGTDRCGSGVNVAGISVPQLASGGADLQVNGNFQPTGSPPYDTASSFAAESAKVKLDWGAIKSGVAVSADITIPGGTFPTTAMFAADTNYWPVIHVTQSGLYGLPNAGRGMLIVDNDLSISGSNQWNGVILVGGQLRSNGNNVSEGATLSGLNRLLGQTVFRATATDSDTSNALANGTKSYVYNSCSVSQATSMMARYTMMPNTWMDNLAGY